MSKSRGLQKFSESFRGILKTFIVRGNEYMPGTLQERNQKSSAKRGESHEIKLLESVGGTSSGCRVVSLCRVSSSSVLGRLGPRRANASGDLGGYRDPAGVSERAGDRLKSDAYHVIAFCGAGWDSNFNPLRSAICFTASSPLA